MGAVEGTEGAVLVARRTFDKVEALPLEVAELLNVEELRTLDDVHDGWGMAIWYVCHAVIAAPTASTAAKEAARWTLANFIPSKRELQATFVAEASRARDREPLLTEGRAKLDLIPTEGGGTLFHWAQAFIEAGKGLDPLLQGRAEAKVDRSEAGKLRSQLISRLVRLRQAMGELLEETPDGGAAIIQSVFSYYDMLEAMRAKGSQDPTPPVPAT